MSGDYRWSDCVVIFILFLEEKTLCIQKIFFESMITSDSSTQNDSNDTNILKIFISVHSVFLLRMAAW